MKHFNFLSNLLSLSLGSPCTDVSLDRRLTVGSPSGLDAKWKQNPFMRFAVVLTLIFTIGVGYAWGTDYTEVATFESGTVVTASSYAVYQDDDWYLSKGGNSSSCGFNKSNKTTLGDSFGTSATSTHHGYYIKSKNKLNKISKITYEFTGHSANGTPRLYLAYSTDGSTWTAISLNSGSGLSAQGVNAATDNTTYTFEFSEISSAYYVIIHSASQVLTTNSHLFRFDNVTATFYAEDVPSCTGTKLGTPVVTPSPSSNSITLSWPNDANATSYTVTCKNTSSGVAAGSVGSVTGTTTKTCTISSLTNGTEYTWSVTAIGNGTTKCDSDPTSANAIPGTYYTVTFKNNGETYATKSIRSGTNLILPDNPSTCDVSKEFVGWSTTNIGSTPTNTKPTMKSTFSTISSATTLYAVFAQKTANSYKLGDANDLIEGQKVLIVNQNASQAMSNTNNSGKLTATGVTISSSTISSPAASLIWTVELDGATKYKFKNTYYVYAYSTSAVYCDDDDSKYPDSWTLTYAGSTGKYYMHSDRGTSSYRLQDYSSNFKLYTSNTTEVFKQSFFIPAYTKYVTQCCTPLGSINGSFFWTTLFRPLHPDKSRAKALFSYLHYVKDRFLLIFECRAWHYIFYFSALTRKKASNPSDQKPVEYKKISKSVICRRNALRLELQVRKSSPRKCHR